MYYYTKINLIMILTTKQQSVLNKYRDGKNIFITGPGGCGKSLLINEMVKISKEQNKVLSVCATTGCAAILLGNNAKTINSWSGIGIANASINEVVSNVVKSNQKRKAWEKAEILIIDEVSMLSKKVFDILDKIGRKAKCKQDEPFGGIQIVCSGDFYQLPPVGGEDEESKMFCFESDNWNNTFNKHQICLKKIFRQDGDETYKKILHQIRKGVISKSSFETLMGCVNKENTSDIVPVKLYPKKYTVDAMNTKFNNAIEGEGNKYEVKVYENETINGLSTITEVKKINVKTKLIQVASLKHIEPLTLKVGSQVMCIVNLDMEGEQQICNGSCGIVVEFRGLNPVVTFHNGRTMEIQRFGRKFEYEGYHYEYDMLPLTLSWAMTIHKSQGASLDIAEIDVGSDIFECGQTYVALSRIKSLDGLFLTSFDVKKIKIKTKVKTFYDIISEY